MSFVGQCAGGPYNGEMHIKQDDKFDVYEPAMDPLEYMARGGATLVKPKLLGRYVWSPDHKHWRWVG